MKYISIDIETTGLDSKRCDIIEFAAVMDDLKNPLLLDQLPIFHCYFKQDYYSGHPFALSMHHEIFKLIAENDENKFNIIKIDNLMISLGNWLCKHNYPINKNNDIFIVNVAGKNAANFDIPFLKEKISNWRDVQFHHRVLDAGSLYLNPLIDTVVPDTKTCMERAGLVGEVAHTALEDAMMVVKLIRHKLLSQPIVVE